MLGLGLLIRSSPSLLDLGMRGGGIKISKPKCSLFFQNRASKGGRTLIYVPQTATDLDLRINEELKYIRTGPLVRQNGNRCSTENDKKLVHI